MKGIRISVDIQIRFKTILGEEIAPFQDISVTHIALLLLRYNRKTEFMKI